MKAWTLVLPQIQETRHLGISVARHSHSTWRSRCPHQSTWKQPRALFSSGIIVIIYLFLFHLFCIHDTPFRLVSSCCRHTRSFAKSRDPNCNALSHSSFPSERNLEGVDHYWSGLIAQ
ncbi:hypothetical protein BDV10DRAFT_2711 [Aspergillus recurvatus]